MLILAVDTATEVESVALVRGGEVLAEHAALRARGHGPTLLDTVDAVLEGNGLNLDAVEGLVCGLGPGSFTGLRVALATLKGFALARALPLFGVQTWRAIEAALPDRRVLVVLDARRGEVFAAGAGLEKPVCCAPAALSGLVPPGPPLTLLGNGALLHAAALLATFPDAGMPSRRTLHHPRAAVLAELADLSAPSPLATLEPLYVRRSDAEINYPDGFPDGTAVPPQKHPNRPG